MPSETHSGVRPVQSWALERFYLEGHGEWLSKWQVWGGGALGRQAPQVRVLLVSQCVELG